MLQNFSHVLIQSTIKTVRSLIFEGREELIPDCVRFQGDCGSDETIEMLKNLMSPVQNGANRNGAWQS